MRARCTLAAIGLLLVGPGVPPAAVADPWSDEQALVESVLRREPSGEPVWLQAGRLRFLALRLPSALPESKGAVLLAHGAGGHVDAPPVVGPLRRRLAEAGWETLSVQLPARDHELGRWQARAASRIAAGVSHLASNGAEGVVLVAHGAGAGAVARYLAGSPAATIRAFVAVSPVYAGTEALSAAWPDQVLEIYGARDPSAVRAAVLAHREQARALPELTLHQLELPGLGLGRDGELTLKWIGGWLDRTLAGDAPAPSQE